LDTFTTLVFLLAQDPKAAPEPTPDATGGLLQILFPVAAAIALYYFMILRPESKRRASATSKLSELKKNDRVVTIGGIYGVVMSVQRDADEVTLKIDEATNTKMRVTFGAIARVIGDDAGDKTAST